MRLRVEREGRTTEVDVDRDLTRVSVDGREYPVRIVRVEAMRVELEVGGEKVLLENWPEHFAEPPGPVDVNGERFRAGVGRLGPAEPPTRASRARADAAPPAPAAPEPAAAGGAHAVLPPMPGKVVEVRVRVGDRVRPGDVLLVVEAMKMRNEVSSPVGGVVREVRVSAGSNVRAREPMLWVEPAA